MEIKVKRGFMFSLFVITALALIVFTFEIRSQFSEERNALIFKERVQSVNAFIEDMKSDCERSLYVVSFRAFLGADEYIQTYDKYLDDVPNEIPELILNGTIKGTVMNSTNSSTFKDWTYRIAVLAKRYNVNVSFDDVTVSVGQASPWLVNISLSANVSVRDFSSTMSWNFSLKKSTQIDISQAHYSDPIYYIESARYFRQRNNYTSSLINSISKTPYSVFWENQSTTSPLALIIDTTNLTNQVLMQYYRENDLAPSFLMRLGGNFGSDINGIESFVNVINASNKIGDFSAKGIPTCSVDYQFFSNNCTDMHNIFNMSTKFYLDWQHLILYNLTAINST